MAPENDFDKSFADLAETAGRTARSSPEGAATRKAGSATRYDQTVAVMAGAGNTRCPLFRGILGRQSYFRNAGARAARRNDYVMFADFRADPRWISAGHAGSGRIELLQDRRYRGGEQRYAARPPGMAGSRGMARGIPGRPVFRSTLLSPQPKRKLHSQMEGSSFVAAGKKNGLEPLRLAPAAAEARGIADGDFVSIHNDRGRCHAYALIDPALHDNVVILPTGSAYDPDGTSDPEAATPTC